MSVREFTKISQLSKLRSQWARLLEQTPSATFFHSLPWLQCYWRHQGQGQRLRVLAVQERGELIGVLPLVIRSEATRLGKLRVLTYPLDGWGPFYSPIGPRPKETLQHGLHYLAQTRRDWDLLDLRWMAAQKKPDPTLEAFHCAGFSLRRRPWEKSAQITFASKWDDYWMSRKGKWRHNCRRNERKLAQRGEVQYVRFRPEGAKAGETAPRWDLYDQCEWIAAQSWQGASTTGTTLSHPSVRSFLRNAHSVAVEQGAADVNLLLVNDQPAAFSYNYVFHAQVIGLRMGYHPQFAAQGAGVVLIKRMLQDGAKRGDAVYNLGEGSLDCKKPWTTDVAQSWSYCHYPLLSPRAQALLLKRWLLSTQYSVLSTQQGMCGCGKPR